MLIWFINKIYLFFILFCCVQSYLLPFSYCYNTIAFFTAFCNQNNSWNRQTANAKKLTKAEDRNPPIIANILT